MGKTSFEKLKKILPGLQKNIPLKNYTTFKIGGPAKYFFRARKKEDLIKAIKTAKEFNLSFFILAGGSNLLISDKGFKGLVIKNEARNFEIKKEKIIAESGAILDKVVERAVKVGLAGLEKGSGIPGTLGGAVYGNAGCPKGDWEIGKLIKEVELLMPNGKIKRVGKNWLSFQYRNSRLKKTRDKKPIILEVILKLKKRRPKPPHHNIGSGGKDLKKRRQEILKIRSEKIPPGFSAGSIFKNPSKKPAGFLIEKCGLKGKKIGKAQISQEHANFIVNLKGAKATDVLKLINLAKKKVKNKFGINLKEEIQFLGF